MPAQTAYKQKSLTTKSPLKVIYPEKSYVAPVKSNVEISQNFVAFSEYINFNALCSKTELTLMICGLLQYADGVAIVFDLSRPETFEGALSWLSDVTQKLFDEKRELAAAEAAHAASTRLNCSAEDSLKVA